MRFNTSNVINMEKMFCSSSCSGFSNFDTRNVKNMSGMFEDYKLDNLNLSRFNTQNVTNMSGMFLNVRHLDNLDLSNFDTRNVTDMSSMFKGRNLIKLNISNFEIKSSCSTESMFYNCIRLKHITTPRTIEKQIELPNYFIRQSNNKVLDKMPANEILKKRIYVKRVDNIKTNNRDTIVVFNGDCYSSKTF